MSNVTRPRGPLPSRVYWVRRLLVLGVALLLVLGVGRLLGGGSDGSTSGDRAATVAGSPTGDASYGPTVPSAPTTTGRRGGRRNGGATPPSTPQASPSSALPEPTGVCADDDVIVTPVPGTPAGGADVVIRLDFVTLRSLACTVAVSPETISLRLSTQKDRFVWSTQNCPAAMPTTTVVARRDVPGSVPVVWPGHYADSTCSAAAPWARPGWYHAVAAVLGGADADVQFQLGPAAAVTITQTASPTSSPTGSAGGSASGPATERPVASAGSTPTGRPARSPSGAVEPNG